MSQKQTRGYSERLAQALRQGPHPMGVRRLAKEVSDGYGHIRGSSYGGIRQYVEGKIQSPRAELLEAIADVLGVRPLWLAFNTGPMTKLQEQAEAEKAQATVHGDPSAIEHWHKCHHAISVGIGRCSRFWVLSGHFNAAGALTQDLVIDLLESGGEDFLAWSPEDIEEASFLLMSLIVAPAHALRTDEPPEGVSRKWPEYFAAMTMAIRASLPERGKGHPREILMRLRAFAGERTDLIIPTGSFQQDNVSNHTASN